MKRSRRRTCGNAALLTFAAHLLEVDIISTSAAAGPSISSALVGSGKKPPSLQRVGGGRRRAFSSTILSRSSTISSTAAAAFVHQESGRGGGVVNIRKSSETCSSSGFSSPPSTTRRRSTNNIWKQRNVSAHLTKNRVDEVTPRYYVSDSSSEDDDVLVYTSYDSEFSLLRPHLEFNELDLQELFSKEVIGAGAGAGGTSTSSSSSSSSQLYEEFEEVEIGHFRRPSPPTTNNPPSQHDEERGESSSSSDSSPFFFASTSVAQPQHHLGETTSTSIELSNLTRLPPWLSLNQARFAPRKLRRLQRDLSPHLSTSDIATVIKAIRLSANNDKKVVAGAVDFCSILVNSLEMTDVPALCAAAYHYSSLVSVRERELSQLTMDNNNNDNDTLLCPVEEAECLETAGSDAKYLCALAGSGIEAFGTHAVKIALDAARLKSMETLASDLVVSSKKNGNGNGSVGSGKLRPMDARNLRSLLLTVNEEGDWRALAVRAAACLYRLEGLEAYRALSSSSSGSTSKTTTTTRFATPEESRMSQEALHIYAPLAARLGMFRLKTELEDAAFRTLYPRSHAKVSALCGGENTNSVGEGMKSILSDISHQMKRLVQEDNVFMEHIENVSVTARVKEPYSVWRKMLKISKELDGANARDISMLNIPDAVATRVVFSARKLTPDESDATTQRREKELCYYLHDLCTRNWPEMSDSRFKDYVKNPKENGYQSLHYSSRTRWRGTEWPFEVQIRSEEMHRVAEYGVAAHWSYKRHDIDGDDTATTQREAYLKSVQKWKKRVNPTWTSPDVEEPSVYLEEEIRRQRKRERDETLAPYLEALSGDQTQMSENVFVFVSVQPPKVDDESSSSASEGTVLSLPKGSRVLDAIRLTEKWSSTLESGSGHLYDGRSSFIALRNGLRTSSMGTELLESGDVISILPSDQMVVRPSSSSTKESFQ